MTEPDPCIDSELARDLPIEEICERYEEAWREGRVPVPSKATGHLSIRCRQCHGPIEIPEQTPVCWYRGQPAFSPRWD